MYLRLICNPAAGKGRAWKAAEASARHLRSRGARVEIYATANARDMIRAGAIASRGSYDRVVCCGGDGSLHLLLRDFDLRMPVGLIPLGSGDDFARVTGVPRKLKAACETVLSGVVRPIDVATANGIRYLGVAGLGFDSAVARYANEKVKRLRGSALYLYSILRVLPSFVAHRVEMQTDQGARTDEIMFVAVANSGVYGGGVRIVPDAQMQDGLLDYCIVHRTSRWQLLKTLPRAYKGTHVQSPFVEIGRTRQMRVTSEQPLQVYADGEPVSETPVSFSIVDEKLKLIVPRGSGS